MKKSRTQYAKKNILSGLINKIVTLGLPFISRTFVVYVLGAQYLGLNSLFTSILQMLNLVELGFSSAIVFSMYKPIAEEDNDKVCALLNLYKQVYRIIGCVVLILGLVLLPFLNGLINSDIPSNINIHILYLIYLINTVLGYLMFSYKSSVLVASQRNDIVTRINTIIILLQNLIQIFFLLITHDYYVYIVIMPICTVFNNLTVAYITSKYYPQYVCHGKILKEELHDLKYKITGLMISKLCATSRNSLDNIILSSMIGLVPVAIYGNYYYIMAGVQSLMSIITISISASVGNSIATETPEKNYQDMMKFMFLYSWLSGVCVNCLLNLYQPFMKIWMGENMMFTLDIVIAFCVYFYSLSLGDIRTLYMTGAGLWWESRYRSILETISNLVLNILLGKLLGVIGVVIATIISILAINFGYGSHIIFKYYFKNKKTKDYFRLHGYCSIIVFISCLFTFFICSLVSFTGMVEIIIKLIISVLFSNIIYIVFFNRLVVYKEAKRFINNNLLITKIKMF